MEDPALLPTRTAAVAALALLVVVLAMHLRLRAGDDLSPWKAGGFAMFSTVDSPGARLVAVWAETGRGEEPVWLDDRWDEQRDELRALPSTARTVDLARSVAAVPLVRAGDGRLMAAPAPTPVLTPAGATPAASPPAAVDVRVVRVEVTRLRYDAGGRVRLQALRSASATPVASVGVG